MGMLAHHEPKTTAPDPRARERTKVWLGLALMTVVAVALTMLFLLVHLPPGLAMTVLSIAAVLVFGALATLVPLGRLALSSWWQRFAVDDGGLHVRHGLRSAYEPFSSLRSVFIDPGTYGRLVVVRIDGRRVLNVPLVASGSSREAELAVRLFERVRGLHRRDPAWEALSRGGRSIEAWMEHLDRVHTAGYRVVPTEGRVLAETVRDATLPVDVRAAAAYLLAGCADRESNLLQAALTERSPALVWAMTWLAAPEALGRAPLGWQRVWDQLAQEDRRVLQRMRSRVSSPPRLARSARGGHG